MLNDDTQLMRYMKFPRFLTLLHNGLSFTPMHRLRSINDPLEGREIADPIVIDTLLEELEHSTAAYTELMSYPVVRDLPRKAQPGEVSETRTLAAAFHSFVSRRRAASCWYANNFESSAMWATFAAEGVAVRTTVGSLCKALSNDREFSIAAVRYRHREKLTIGIGNYEKFPHLALRPYLLKGREFEHEREVRIVTRCHETDRSLIVKIPRLSECIHEIIISPYLQESDAVAIKALIEQLLAKAHGVNTSVPVSFSTINKTMIAAYIAEAAADDLAAEYLSNLDEIPL
ncbi:MAG TPA: DUF2971 domain-containing protein [Opitutaceae bacterium]|nr:DUF2971 domain-containing protein [Opitutaceae bacterium]